MLREISTLLALLKNNYQTAIDRYEICEKKQQVADEIYKDELKKYELGSSQLMSLSEKKMLVIQARQFFFIIKIIYKSIFGGIKMSVF